VKNNARSKQLPDGVKVRVSLVCEFKVYICLLNSCGLHRLIVTILHTIALSVLVHWVNNAQDGAKRSERKDVCYAVILLLIISEKAAQCCKKQVHQPYDSIL